MNADSKIKPQLKLGASSHPNMITPNHNIFLQYYSQYNNTMIVPVGYPPVSIDMQDASCYSRVNANYSSNPHSKISTSIKLIIFHLFKIKGKWGHRSTLMEIIMLIILRENMEHHE